MESASRAHRANKGRLLWLEGCEAKTDAVRIAAMRVVEADRHGLVIVIL